MRSDDFITLADEKEKAYLEDVVKGLLATLLPDRFIDVRIQSFFAHTIVIADGLSTAHFRFTQAVQRP